MQDELNKELVLAAEAGNSEEVKTLLKKGGDPNAMGPNSAALHCAAFGGYNEVVDLLLKAGADVQLKDKQGLYPLHLAASREHIACLNLLIKAGANLEAATEKGGTALHVAAASGFPKAINLLLKAGAQLEVLDSHEATPLFAAAQQGQNAAVKSLLKAGANIHHIDKYGENVLFGALRQLRSNRLDGWSSEGSNGGVPVKYELVKGLFLYHKAGKAKILSLKDQRYCAAQHWGPAKHLAYLDALDTVQTLLAAGAAVNVVSVDNLSPLHIACHSGEARIIKALLEKGANTNIKDNNLATPLHYAAGAGRYDGLETFLSMATDFEINAPAQKGWTPLHYYADIGGDLKMLDMLIKHGADPKIKSMEDFNGIAENSTAEDVARYWKDEEVGDALKKLL